MCKVNALPSPHLGYLASFPSLNSYYDSFLLCVYREGQFVYKHVYLYFPLFT